MKQPRPSFKNDKGDITQHTSAIVPIVTVDKQTSKTIFIGTAFYISTNGLLLTAKHNLFEKENQVYDNLGVIHILPENKYILRPIIKYIYSEEYDISYLMPAEIKNKNGEIVTNHILTLTETIPVIDEQLSTYAYPNSKSYDSEIHFNADFFLGNFKEYYPDGFSFLKHPCYRTSILIKGGASGGPVFNNSGQVFAVNSTGYDLGEGEESISFVTPISPSFNLELEDQTGQRFSIRSLINDGFIIVKS